MVVDVTKVERLFKRYFRYSGVITHIDPESGKVDVDGFVSLNKKVQKLPVKFENITGSFDCGHSALTTLAGSPSHVQGNFTCMSNQLTSLAHAPEYVGGDFGCGNNQLTNLVGAPEHVYGHFYCGYNPLTSLQGLPQTVVGELSVNWSPQLPMMRLLNYPKLWIRDEPDPVKQIRIKYMHKGQAGVIKCAAEMIRAGYKENARW